MQPGSMQTCLALFSCFPAAPKGHGVKCETLGGLGQVGEAERKSNIVSFSNVCKKKKSLSLRHRLLDFSQSLGYGTFGDGSE